MAVFRRSDTLWLVFDTPERIDLAALQAEQSRTVRSAEVTELPGAKIVRLKLERPRLASLTSEGASWMVTIGDSVAEPPKPLAVSRNLNGARPTLSISFDEPQKIHRVIDPDIGDTLLVVTALGPARGFLKPQDFVELRALSSTHGVAIQPLADDLTIELAPDKIILGRPNGLSLSSIGVGGRRNNSFRPLMFDPQVWGTDRAALFPEQQAKLAAMAAQAPESKRAVARLDLAKFYLARDMYAEAKGVLNVVIGDTSPNAVEDVSALVLRGVASILMDRPEEGLKDLSNPLIGNQYDAPLWRAFAYARQGRWAEARDTFKGVEASMGALPVELQRKALIEALRAAIEVRDFAGAGRRLNEFELVGTPRELEPAVAVLTGRVAEGLGKTEDALNAFHTAADSWDRRAAAQGQLRELTLRLSTGDIKRPELISDLETLTTVWRGDETEVEALALLAKLYTQDGSYRNAFNVMRTALMAHPNSDMTRRIHDEAALTFDSLFLAGKGDSMPAIDALSLFYDFRELTPIGRRGDEMIRRLSDRLVSVDLLEQASELLQHQVDHRLQGAARAQVATRLAVVYLMNRKPDKALSTLRATRSADLSNELRNQRLLIEARALSDIGRHDVALEVIANMDGTEAVRLRSDIYWSARRWREAAEQIELMLGERWKEFPPLAETERADILRAAIGYALGEDALGLMRFREKYAAKMMESADRRSFEIVTQPLGTGGGDFRDVARAIAAVNTLDGFLREMRVRYPATGTAGSTPTPPAVPGGLPPGVPAPGARAAAPTTSG
jgi:tetratricopeptide (TPR) repeat protein